MLNKTIAFVGAGNMAGALIRGLIGAGTCKPEAIHAIDLRLERLKELESQHPGLGIHRDLRAGVQVADVVVLSVKPQSFHQVLGPLSESLATSTLVISIAAGVPLSAIEARLPPGTHVIRAMPNTPALVDAGATALSKGSSATEADLQLVTRIFGSVGITVSVDESLLDAVTGLSGSGPAYVFLMIEALSDAGVKMGLRRDDALSLAAQTMFGAAKLLLDTKEHPGRLKDQVTSPGGTAIAGLHTLEQGGMRTTLINAVETATLRAKELGEQLGAELIVEDEPATNK